MDVGGVVVGTNRETLLQWIRTQIERGGFGPTITNACSMTIGSRHWLCFGVGMVVDSDRAKVGFLEGERLRCELVPLDDARVELVFDGPADGPREVQRDFLLALATRWPEVSDQWRDALQRQAFPDAPYGAQVVATVPRPGGFTMRVLSLPETFWTVSPEFECPKSANEVLGLFDALCTKRFWFFARRESTQQFSGPWHAVTGGEDSKCPVLPMGEDSAQSFPVLVACYFEHGPAHQPYHLNVIVGVFASGQEPQDYWLVARVVLVPRSATLCSMRLSTCGTALDMEPLLVAVMQMANDKHVYGIWTGLTTSLTFEQIEKAQVSAAAPSQAQAPAEVAASGPALAAANGAALEPLGKGVYVPTKPTTLKRWKVAWRCLKSDYESGKSPEALVAVLGRGPKNVWYGPTVIRKICAAGEAGLLD